MLLDGHNMPLVVLLLDKSSDALSLNERGKVLFLALNSWTLPEISSSSPKLRPAPPEPAAAFFFFFFFLAANLAAAFPAPACPTKRKEKRKRVSDDERKKRNEGNSWTPVEGGGRRDGADDVGREQLFEWNSHTQHTQHTRSAHTQKPIQAYCKSFAIDNIINNT